MNNYRNEKLFTDSQCLLLFNKILITIAFLFITGLPFIWLHKTFLPPYAYIITSILIIIPLSIYWREFFRFKKAPSAWTITILILILAISRRYFLPPPIFKIYDLFLIFIAFSGIYESSKIKDLLVFSSILIAPLALAELYGFMPTCIASGILLSAGFLSALFLPRLYGFIRRSKDETQKPGMADFIVLLLSGMLLILFSILIIIFPKGETKRGRIVFDIGHEGIESPQLFYTTNLDVSKAYGHGNLAELLMYYDFGIDYIEHITKENLSNTDILVLIMCTKSYKIEEIKAIREFVHNGGSLLVIGDHTDINNTASTLNPIIGQFGIRFRFDTIWLETNDRMNLRYLPHPVHFDIERVNFSVGASLDLISPAEALIQSGYTVYSDYGDANNKNNGYLGNSRLDKGERIKDLTLAAYAHYGKGRVLVLGDSAYFQNTSIYQNSLFTYRVFDWLNHNNSNIRHKHRAILILMPLLIFFVIFIFYGRRFKPDILFAAVGLFLVLSIWVGGIINIFRYPLPKGLRDTILIDLAHQNEYGTYWTNKADPDTSLDGFIAQILRLGYCPVLKTEGTLKKDELKRYNALFIICPNFPFSHNEMDAVMEFCEEGGGILLLEGARKWACSSELWGRFGLHKERFPLSLDNPIKMPSIDLPLRLPYGKFEAEFIHHPITMGMYKKIRMVNPCWVKGGLPIAFVNQRPVISYKEFGKGRIIAIGDDRIFAGFIVEKEEVIDRQKVKFIFNIVNYLVQK